ncbi:Fe-S protein assembly chaperone HscA [Zavarzinia compransoris]|uniref:Chaperone protein HscA homolog n=1 Tax=Zavarzinia compransoris TaxID=1264899 RepID=A0A317EBX2_9PROT|nr:Fe-S protein assembly chaperone HscA [Zavarzinia compransoris]PWR23756.1 Fe-S protein assembly chaperone HscA [Zavarzinia compransoris]TDP47985.1 chaperone protein HscA [Zavarzinia compransoris]
MLLDIYEPGETPLPHAGDADTAAVGIDLGTTNSLVAIAVGGRPEILRDALGDGIVPSVVAYLDGDDEPVVGRVATRILEREPELVVASVKRLMGRGTGDVASLGGHLAQKVHDDGQGGMVKLDVGGRIVSPVQVSAEILRTLKQRAEMVLGKGVDRAVITVPAYFDDAARTATRDAARLAGLEVLRLVNEPTAAALAYGLDKGAEGLYAVYDLGGGTFDVSLLRLEKGVFQVLATGGDAALGGDDFDRILAERLLAARGDAIAAGDVKPVLAAARRAKEGLTDADEVSVDLDFGGKATRHPVTRAQFDDWIGPLVARTIAAARAVLADAGVEAGELAGIVLVGGSTRVPLVRGEVARLFGREPLSDIDPDEVVALGAALQAEALTIGSDTLLLDVVPLSLGLETMGGLVEKVIPRNTPIPVSRAQDFTTYQDGQTAMAVHVLQGEREMVEQNRSLARFVLAGIPAMVAGAARIRVTFTVDADGLLTVAAREALTGVEAHVEVKPSYGLSDEDMAEMLRASFENARADVTTRLLAEARVDGRRLILALDAALAQDGDLLAAGERAEVDTAKAALEAAMAGDDREAVVQATEALEAAGRPFAERRMDRNIRQALAGVEVRRLETRLQAG